MNSISAERFAGVVAEVADTLVDNFDLIDFLHMVTSHTADLLEATAVGLMLADVRGDLHFVAASHEAAEMLELFQVQNQEGPCLDAFRSGKPVTSADLSTATDRWPTFAPRAVAAGFSTVHAMPMRLRDQVIGALNVFAEHPRQLDMAEVAIVQALADVATIGLLQERAIQRGALLAEQLQKALTSRVIIEQAKGAIAQVHRTTVNQAFLLLRSYARSHHHNITDLATACLNEPERFPELMQRP